MNFNYPPTNAQHTKIRKSVLADHLNPLFTTSHSRDCLFFGSSIVVSTAFYAIKWMIKFTV